MCEMIQNVFSVPKLTKLVIQILQACIRREHSVSDQDEEQGVSRARA
jgi:hypothetical protein